MSMTPEAQAILQTTKQILTSEVWIKDRRARDCDGNGCSSLDDSARQFCLGGALSHAVSRSGIDPIEENRAYFEAHDLIMRAIEGVSSSKHTYNSIADFNDSQTTKEPIISLIVSALDIGARPVYQRIATRR